mmetsp:Transcript_39621/g.91553  ORF Transcript_39621/g.91553 Transcript_39621/m.91553 type:complete len:209 (+) Transcript_39621:222-848(+)
MTSSRAASFSRALEPAFSDRSATVGGSSTACASLVACLSCFMLRPGLPFAAALALALALAFSAFCFLFGRGISLNFLLGLLGLRLFVILGGSLFFGRRLDLLSLLALGWFTESLPLRRGQLGDRCDGLARDLLGEGLPVLLQETAKGPTCGPLWGLRVLLALGRTISLAILLGAFFLATCFQERLHVLLVLSLCFFVLLLVDSLLSLA